MPPTRAHLQGWAASGSEAEDDVDLLYEIQIVPATNHKQRVEDTKSEEIGLPNFHTLSRQPSYTSDATTSASLPSGKYASLPPAQPSYHEFSTCEPSPKIPRPPNSFILFRGDYCREHTGSSNTENKSLSARAAEAWKLMTREEKGTYERLAEQEKERHAQLYPNYRYKPAKKRSRMVAGVVQKNAGIQRDTSSPRALPRDRSRLQSTDSRYDGFVDPETIVPSSVENSNRNAQRRSSSVPFLPDFSSPSSAVTSNGLSTSKLEHRRSMSMNSRPVSGPDEWLLPYQQFPGQVVMHPSTSLSNDTSASFSWQDSPATSDDNSFLGYAPESSFEYQPSEWWAAYPSAQSSPPFISPLEHVQSPLSVIKASMSTRDISPVTSSGSLPQKTALTYTFDYMTSAYSDGSTGSVKRFNEEYEYQQQLFGTEGEQRALQEYSMGLEMTATDLYYQQQQQQQQPFYVQADGVESVPKNLDFSEYVYVEEQYPSC